MTGSRRQRGMTLYVVLVLLAGLGLLAATGLRSGQTNLMAVGNMQSRHDVMAAAKVAIEQAISSPQFTEQPEAVAAARVPVDLDGDGRPDEVARLTPQPSCYNFRVVRQQELDPEVEADRACLRGTSSMPVGSDTEGQPQAASMCADSEWHLRAVVESPQSGARAAVNQGIAIRGLVTDAENNCP